MPENKTYLDTCIVSGLAKGDLDESNQAALLRVLKARKRGDLEIVTSSVAADEINAIPPDHRLEHEVMYNLLDDVHLAAKHQTHSGLTLLGAGGGRREHPMLRSLRALLPDENDAVHVFQAARNECRYFLTTDRRTILKYRDPIKECSEVEVVSPAELVESLGLT